ncbi:MAG TPA: Crp/Fnr family transcriptional regulator [Rubrobacter sp.]|jgi:CRP-like cAMP-binding protein
MSLSGERIRLLSMVDVFESLSTEEIGRLDERLPDAHLETGEIFYSPDDPSEKVFILRRGKARIYKVADDDREFTLAVVGAGTMFGEMTLTAQRLQGAYAQALEPSEVSMMLRKDLERLILEKPQVGLQIAHLLSERLRRYEIRLEDITLKDVPSRLASMILLLAEAEGVVTAEGFVRIPTHYTHQQLGSMIGTNRETVSRAFGVLQEETIVELRRRIIHVKSLEALRRRAGHADRDMTQDP